MTSSTAPTTSSSPHFCLQCSTNCFQFSGAVVCVGIPCLCRGFVLCVDVCIVIFVVVSVVVVVIVIARHLHHCVVVCVVALASKLQRRCCNIAPHLHRGVVVYVAASSSELWRCSQRRGVIVCVIVHCLHCGVVVCGCILCCLRPCVIVCFDGVDNVNAHHCHSRRYRHQPFRRHRHSHCRCHHH